MTGKSSEGREEVDRLAEEFLERYRAGEWPQMADYIRRHPHLEKEIREVFPALLLMERVGTAGPPEPEPSPETVGPYRIERLLGTGGQGEVYLAEDGRLGRKVALKVMPRSADPAGRMLERFRREGAVAARLDHPGICTVYEAGTEGGRPYIAMRFVDGESLAQWVEATRGSESTEVPGRTRSESVSKVVGDVRSRDGVLRIVEVAEKAARALDAAHRAGLIHRDIKPGNIMVTPEGEPVILDFGLAREEEEAKDLTLTGTLMGTPAYMSPEQITAQRIRLDRRTDIYSLGVTLYECLTLRLPFEAPTRDQLYHKILVADPEDPRRLNASIPADLRVVLETALDKDRDHRYQTAADFAEDLRRVRLQEPILARPAGPILKLRRWAQRNPQLAVAVAALLVVTGAIFAQLVFIIEEGRRFTRENAKAFAQLRDERDAKEAALGEERRERIARDAALAGKEAALRRAEGLRLLSDSSAALSRDPGLALRLAIEGAQRCPGFPADQALREALLRCRERRVIRGAGDQVSSVDIDADGRRIATISGPYSEVVQAWDVATGKEDFRVEVHGAGSVAFSPDGRRLAVLDSRREESQAVVILDAQSGEKRATFPCPAGNASEFAFGGDGARLVVWTAGSHGSAVVLDAKDGKQLASVADLEGAPSFSPDGGRILFHAGGKVKTLDLRDGNESSTWDPGERQVLELRWTAAGPRVVDSGPEEGSGVRVLDGQDGRPVCTLKDVKTPLSELLVDPDGLLVFVARKEAEFAELFDAVSGEPRATLEACSATNVSLKAFSPDGRTIAVLHIDQWSSRTTLRTWDSLTGRLLAELRGHSGDLEEFRFSRDSRSLVSASWDGTARLWDLRMPSEALARSSVGGRIAFSPDGTLLMATGGMIALDGWRQVLDAGTVEDRLPSAKGTAVFGPDGRWFAAILQSGVGKDGKGTAAAAILETATGDQRRLFAAEGDDVAAIALSPDGRRLATCSMGRPGVHEAVVRVWNAEDGREMASFRAESILNRFQGPKMTLDRGGERLLFAGRNRVHLWDIAAGREVWSMEGWSAFMAPDGRRVLVVDSQASQDVWIVDSATGKTLVTLPVHPHAAVSGAFSPDGDRVATAGGWDRTARIWDAGTGRLLMVLEHEHPVEAVVFSPDGRSLATTSMAGVVRVWDVATGAERASLESPVGRNVGTGFMGPFETRTAFSPDGSRLATVFWDGTLVVVPLDPLPAALRRGARDLTEEERDQFLVTDDHEQEVKRRGKVLVAIALARQILAADTVEAVRTEPGIDGETRDAALRIARDLRDDPDTLAQKALSVVVLPGRAEEEYLRGLRWAEAASRITPADGGVLFALGAAQYRLGRTAEALATLLRADGENFGGWSHGAAFLAMAEQMAGHTVEAGKQLDRYRRDVAANQSPLNREGRNALLREVEALVEGKPDPAGGKR